MMSIFACDCCPNVTPNFGMKGMKEISDRIFYMNKISVVWMRIGT